MSRASNYFGYRALGRGRKLTRSSSYSVGSVLCPPSQMVPVVSSFTAQVIVFEPKYPITAGYAVELFHHSRDIPATIASLDAILDKASGQVTKAKPRSVLACLSSAPSPRRANAAESFHSQDAHERLLRAHQGPAPKRSLGWTLRCDPHRAVLGQQKHGPSAVPEKRRDGRSRHRAGNAAISHATYPSCANGSEVIGTY